MPLTLTKRGVDVFAPQDAGGNPRAPVLGEAQVWTTEIESAVGAAVSGFAVVTVVDTGGSDPATDYEAGDMIDSVELATGDLVLRATAGGNAADGIYVVPPSGAASRSGAFATYDSHPGVQVSVMRGAVHGDTIWTCTSNTGGTLGSTALVFTHALLMDLGSAAAPALAFARDPDTGAFRPGANILGFAAGGNEVFRLQGNPSGHFYLEQDTVGSRIEIQKTENPEGYPTTKTALIVQTEHTEDYSGGAGSAVESGSILFTMDKDFDGPVTKGSPSSSQYVMPNLRIFTTNRGDGSTPSIAANTTIYEPGEDEYNEGGILSATIANAASPDCYITGTEIVVRDNTGVATPTNDTLMTVHTMRMDRKHDGSRMARFMNLSSEGVYPPDEIMGLNPNGLAQVKRGFNLVDWTFTEGRTLINPNDTAIAWADASGGLHDILEVNGSNQTIMRSAASGAALLLLAPAGTAGITIQATGGGRVDMGKPMKLVSHTVANAPSASTMGAGSMIWVSNGDAGSPCVAVSDGTDWLVISTGSAISAS